MPQPEAPAARSGAIQGAAYSESASNGASMPAPARSRFPKLAFFITLLGYESFTIMGLLLFGQTA